LGAAETTGAVAPNARALDAALRRYWPLIALMGLLLAGAGVAAGLTREPIYTSSAQLNVGQTSLAAQSIPGFAEGTRTLAASYSRLATSFVVTDAVARQAGLSRDFVRDRVSSDPLPESSVFVVRGEGVTPRAAEMLTRATADATRRHIDSLYKNNEVARDAFERFRRATRKAARYEAQLTEIRSRPTASRSAAVRRRIVFLRERIGAARLIAEASAASYQESNRRTPSGDRAVAMLNPPEAATSDKWAVTQRYALLGLLIGLLGGFGVALGLSARRARRT